MKIRNVNLKISVLSLAMVGVFNSMYAYADEGEAAALMSPTSSVEVEVISVSNSSQKFGEYNGLNKQGGHANGNLTIRGGDAYKNNANGGTERWSVIGTDLGLSDRSASVGYSDQGNWGVGVGYDQLQHNMASGYRTPYVGQMGGNGWGLPSSFGTITDTTVSTINNLTPAKQNAITPMDISSTRENTLFTAVKIIDPSLSFNLDFNHLGQTGAKLMGFASSTVGGASSQKISILPNPTNYQTDTLNLAANWMGERGRLTASYFGSFFRDAYNQVNWTTFSGANATQTMSTAPSNQLQQLNLNGGYDFSNSTKLTGGLSFGRNTQNSSSGYDSGMIVVGAPPVTPFNGLVNSSHADIKVTDKTIQDLNLSASYKYDSRINLSQSNMQQFVAVNGSDPAAYPNTPLSYRKGIFDLAGEYKLDKAQRVGVTYSNQNINRFCNQYATGITNTSGTNGYYPAGADCVTANNSQSNLFDAFYKLRAGDSVNVKVGYGYDVRRTSMNTNAIAAFSGVQNRAGTGTYITPNGINNNGQNGGDYLGYQPFFEASRNQQAAKARISWNATDEITTGLNGKYTYSTYPDSTYGVQNGTAWSLAWDGAYQYAEAGFISAYAVQQNGQRNLTNYISAVSATSGGVGTWNNNLSQHDTTFGIGFKHEDLVDGKLNLNGDLTYSLGQTFYNTTPGSFVSMATTASTSNLNYANGSFGAPPAIRNDLIAVKLGGTYKIDKNSKLGLQYLYQRLVASDYYYNAYQYGTTSTATLPTYQNAGGYNVNVITVGYTYTFD